MNKTEKDKKHIVLDIIKNHERAYKESEKWLDDNFNDIFVQFLEEFKQLSKDNCFESVFNAFPLHRKKEIVITFGTKDITFKTNLGSFLCRRLVRWIESEAKSTGFQIDKFNDFSLTIKLV